MVHHAAFSRECSPTDFTLKGIFSTCMCVFMAFEISHSGESLVTKAAFEISLTSVGSFMVLQMAALAECLVTLTTFESFLTVMYSHYMFPQCVCSTERFVASATMEWLFANMDKFMPV